MDVYIFCPSDIKFTDHFVYFFIGDMYKYRFTTTIITIIRVVIRIVVVAVVIIITIVAFVDIIIIIIVCAIISGRVVQNG